MTHVTRLADESTLNAKFYFLGKTITKKCRLL